MKIAAENANSFGADHLQESVPSDGPACGAITRAGFIGHIDTCVRHLAALLVAGGGEPANTQRVAAAESARVQLWRWLHAGNAALDDGTPINFALFDTALQRVGERLPRRGMPGQENLMRAAWLLAELTHAHTLAETLPMGSPDRRR